jgi:hypothetical protein
MLCEHLMFILGLPDCGRLRVSWVFGPGVVVYHQGFDVRKSCWIGSDLERKRWDDQDHLL